MRAGRESGVERRPHLRTRPCEVATPGRQGQREPTQLNRGVRGGREGAHHLAGRLQRRLRGGQFAPAEVEVRLEQGGPAAGVGRTGRGARLVDEPGGLGPLPQGVEGLGLVAQGEGAHVRASARRRPLRGACRRRDGLARAAHRLQFGRDVDVGPRHDSERADGQGLFAGPAHLGEPGVDVSGLRGEYPEGRARLEFDGGGADDTGQLDGAYGRAHGLDAGPVPHAPARRTGQHVRVHRRRRQTPHQLLRAADLVPAVAPAQRLDDLRALDPEPGGAQRVLVPRPGGPGRASSGRARAPRHRPSAPPRPPRPAGP